MGISLKEKAAENLWLHREEEFKRVTEGDYEIVEYMKGSSIRIWHNGHAESYPSHWHPAMEVIMPLRNGYTVTVQQTEYQLQEGDILLIPAGELHQLAAPPDGERLICLFDFNIISGIKGFSSFLPLWSHAFLITAGEFPLLIEEERRLLLEVEKEYSSGRDLTEPVIYSYLIHFFVNLGRTCNNREIAESYVKSNRRGDILERLDAVFQYLDEHYMEEITLDSVADIAGFSKFHFTRLFKQCSGQNFSEYLCHKRIKAAELLLMHPDINVTEIALRSGFLSISSFNRTFRKIKNCTPSEYRSLCSKSNRRDTMAGCDREDHRP